MKRDLKSAEAFRPSLVCEVIIASDSDIRFIENHPEKTSIAFIYKGRLQAGHTCYVAKNENQILGFIWVNPESFAHFYGSEHPFLFHPLEKSECFTYDWHVFQANRNRGVLKCLVQFMFDDLLKKGVTAVYSTVEMKNTASIRAHQASGFSPSGFIHLYRVGNMRQVFGGTQGEARALCRWLERIQKRGVSG
jgi:RimJ/RimL family protein N-acetyltransferase